MRKRLGQQELLDNLSAIEDMLEYESWGKDHEAYWETVREKWETIHELQERFGWRPGKQAPPPPAAPPVKPAKPAARICAHTRCDKPVQQKIYIPDDHDSNAGAFYLNDYCSLECFVCDLAHTRDDVGSTTVVDIVKRITG